MALRIRRMNAMGYGMDVCPQSIGPGDFRGRTRLYHISSGDWSVVNCDDLVGVSKSGTPYGLGSAAGLVDAIQSAQILFSNCTVPFKNYQPLFGRV